MAYLNQAEREALLNQLKKLSFRRAKGRLRRLDDQGTLTYYRNNQRQDEYVTCFTLAGKGTRVQLVERKTQREGKPAHMGMNRLKPRYDLVRVIVEPTPENRT